MTQQVVWLCPDCNLPVTFTCGLEHIAGTKYRVHADPHIHAHRRQHRG